jgi:glucose-1-phosphate cytidylyltransferase
MIKKLTCLIFCGGKGSRLGNLTKSLPKPLLKIKKDPIVFLIMKHYLKYGVKNFLLLVGYKNYKFIEILDNKSFEKTIINKDLIDYKIKINDKSISVKILNTGLNSSKKKRLLLAKKYIEDEVFFLTYGDGLSNINIKKQYSFFTKKNKIGLITAVNPPSRFGEVKLNKDYIKSFSEKPTMSSGFINGGFMIFSNEIFRYIDKDEIGDFESSILPKLTKQKQILAFKHLNFWQCIDNERELNFVNSLIKKNIKLKRFYGI